LVGGDTVPIEHHVATVSNPTNPPVNFTGISPVQGGIHFNWQAAQMLGCICNAARLWLEQTLYG